MADDVERNTPPGLPPTQWRLSELERLTQTDHARLRAISVAIDIGVGRDGRGGRLAEVGAEHDALAAEVQRIERICMAMDKAQAVASVKLAAIVTIMSAIGSIASTVVLRALFGG